MASSLSKTNPQTVVSSVKKSLGYQITPTTRSKLNWLPNVFYTPKNSFQDSRNLNLLMNGDIEAKVNRTASEVRIHSFTWIYVLQVEHLLLLQTRLNHAIEVERNTLLWIPLFAFWWIHAQPPLIFYQSKLHLHFCLFLRFSVARKMYLHSTKLNVVTASIQRM